MTPSELLFDPGPVPSVPIIGRKERFPVHRIYCVGRNYAAHAREMGKNPDKEPPFFFLTAKRQVLQCSIHLSHSVSQ